MSGERNRPLQLWNGPGWIVEVPNRDPWRSERSLAAKAGRRCHAHVYVAAHSRADAARMILSYRGGVSRHSASQVDREMRVYFSHGCWGNSMEDVNPERGLWVIFEGSNNRYRLV